MAARLARAKLKEALHEGVVDSYDAFFLFPLLTGALRGEQPFWLVNFLRGGHFTLACFLRRRITKKILARFRKERKRKATSKNIGKTRGETVR